jgi:hypothetical protein
VINIARVNDAQQPIRELTLIKFSRARDRTHQWRQGRV